MMSFSSFLAASLLGVAALGGRVEAEVLVGVADTFSGPGGWGVQVKRSIDLAADEVNEAGWPSRRTGPRHLVGRCLRCGAGLGRRPQDGR